jgi:hypothetical protein
MMAVAVEDGNGTIAVEDNGMQDRVTDYDGEGQEQAVREVGDSGVVIMAAAAEDGGGGQLWRRWGTTATADNDSGGRRRWQMMTAHKIERQSMMRMEESGQQTTTALGLPGRGHETKIKKLRLSKKTFFSDTVCLVGVFAPT